jgi:Type I phosphodiesterase / nucleotide pyrophosphatase
VVVVLALAVAVFLGGITMTAGWIALFFVGADEPNPKSAPADPVRVRVKPRRLLWLVFDAMRKDVAFDAALMPNFAALRRQGVWGVARTGSFTMTGTCVRAMGTGVNPQPTHAIHNFRSPPVRGDSLFRRIHRAGRRIVLIGDHIWVDLYRNTVRKSYPQPDLGINDVYRTDRAALKDARKVLSGGWDLVVMHLVGSDHAAHKERSVRGLYRKKLAEYDALIPELRRLMGPDAAVLIVADHACNSVGNHGAGEQEATLAPYVLAGPGVLPLGRRDIDQRTFAPTVTALLGVSTPWGAEVPGLLDSLAVSESVRADVSYNHAVGRRAHLRHIRGRGDSELDRLLDQAVRARATGQHRAARRASEAVIVRATALRLAHVQSSPWLWLAALSLLLSVPLLLLVGADALSRGRGLIPALITLGTSAVGIVSVFVLSARTSTPLCAGLLAAQVVVWILVERRLAVARWLPLALAPFALGVLGAWTLDWLKRMHYGDPSGSLWLALPALALVLAGLVWWVVSGRLRRGLRDQSALATGLCAALVAAALFLPLPFLRWWGGRHLVVGLLGATLVLGLAAWARWRRLLNWRMAVGAGVLSVSLGLGLAFDFGRGQSAHTWFAVAIALGVPAVLLLLGGVRPRSLGSVTGCAVLAAWTVAQLPRLGLNIPYIAFGVVGLAFVVLLWRRQGRGAHLALLSLALLRLLSVDHVVAATAILGASALGLASVGRRPRGLALAGLGVLMALLELVLFYQLGREFAFGTIDVRMGFVGGGEINLVRITIMVLLANAIPWWLLWSGAADLTPESPAWLDRLLVVLLWILAVKVLGTFLLFAGRPAHFWLIHSLIPFQFFGLANLLMIVSGYGLARTLASFSCQADSSSDESRATL